MIVLNGINVLSEFDGISCGQLALQRAGIPVNKYFASEIDKYAIQITQKNFPDTIQLGDVKNWRSWDLPKIDLLIAGSPCQGFSIAGKRLNFDDPRSKLFFDFVDTLEHLREKNPDIVFLLENVNRMHKDVKAEISRILDVEPIMINSALVSAQNRERLYWTNIEGITQPEDKGIILADILEYDIEEKFLGGYNPSYKSQSNSLHNLKGKSKTIHAGTHGYSLGYIPVVRGAAKRNQVTKRGVEAQLNVRKDDKSNCVVPSYSAKLNGVVFTRKNKVVRVGDLYPSGGQAGRIYSVEGKSPALNTASTGGNQETKIAVDYPTGLKFVAGIEKGRRLNDGKNLSRNYREGSRIYSPEGKSVTLSAQPKGGSGGYTGLYGDEQHYRKLTPVECERLQTLPDNYTEGISNTQRYKSIGNGWTIDVISHIFSFLPDRFFGDMV